MSYATPEDVTDLFRNIDITSDDSAITETKLQKWLDSEFIYIRGKVETLYEEVNADSHPLSAKVLAEIEAMLVAAKVDDILNNYTEADKKPNWEKRAQMRLEEYIPKKDKDGKQPEPTVKLPDAVYIGTRTQNGALKVSSTATPIFSKGGDNW